MAASSLLISSLPAGLILGDVKNSNNTSAVCPIKSSLRGRLDTNKLGFVSCKAFSNGTLSTGKLKVSYVSKRKFSGHSAGVARCETTDENKNSLGIWLGRAAMLGFVGVVSVEVATGKGVLENVGLVAPLPMLALALMAVVGGITAFGIFRSVNDS